MTGTIRRAALSAALSAAALCSAALCSPGFAASPEEERVLGSDAEDAQLKSYLPFTRSLGTSGIVRGSLADSTAAAGVPPAAMLEAINAFGTAIDLERDLRDGDRFYVRYERTFTIEGHPIGTGRVLWAELRTAAKGTLAIHRFRVAKTDADAFWFANGQGTQAPVIQMPLRTISVSSGFGLRADPFDQPWGRSTAMGPGGGPGGGQGSGTLGDAKQAKGQAQTPQPSPLGPAGAAVNNATPLGVAMGLSPIPIVTPAVNPVVNRSFTGFRGSMMMHEGVDLVAAPGTPILAAADGIVVGAEPKGRYGNWLEIAHDGKLATVYGHLLAFAPGIAPGARVERGDVVGFTGMTGRTTGPHLHFELLSNGRPTNPIANPATKHGQLRGPDLLQLKKVVARDMAEREREAKSM